MIPHYHINVFWFDPDGCWIADVPDLDGCSAHGASPEEAIREGQIAISEWLAAAADAGLAIPEPRYKPAIYARFDGLRAA